MINLYLCKEGREKLHLLIVNLHIPAGTKLCGLGLAFLPNL